MPATIRIVKGRLASLPEPQRFDFTDLDCIQPGVSRSIISKLKDYVDFFERAECGFRVEEVNERYNGEVGSGEDDPCVV